MLCTAQCAAQWIEAEAYLDTNRIQIGFPVGLSLEAKANSSVGSWPSLPDTFGALEILKREAPDSVLSSNGIMQYRQHLVLTGWDSGMHTIPALPFGPVQTEPLQLLVETVPVDTTQPFAPIKDIIEPEATFWERWRAVILIAGGVLLLVILLLLLRFRKRAGPRTAEGAAARAMRALARLEEERLLDTGRIRPYYERLSAILRTYLLQRFGLRTGNRTTPEILSAAQGIPVLVPHAAALESVLDSADLAKFAKGIPTPEEGAAAVVEARHFVQLTDASPSTQNTSKAA